jgi:hypothetical protein
VTPNEKEDDDQEERKEEVDQSVTTLKDVDF